MVRRAGFHPYLAIEVHSPSGLATGIYEHLRTSEYFLFVDFARDRLGRSSRARGSLFSNQELAIASYLSLDSLYFVDSRIARREGILGAIQGNPIEFDELRSLPRLISRNLREAKWDCDSRLELRVEPLPGVPSDARIGRTNRGAPILARFWQFRIRNLHPRIVATDCRIQVVDIRGPGAVAASGPLEAKFAGITWPTVAVPPLSTRQFDALIVPHSDPRKASLGVMNPVYVDSERTLREHSVGGSGDYEADILVLSREFRPVRGRIEFHLGTSLADVRLRWTQT